jgi:hypothetical protein
MSDDCRATEKPYSPKARFAPNLRLWVVSLAPVLLIGLAPFAILLFIIHYHIRPHYASLDLLPVFVGCWLIFAVWITLHKGMGSLLLSEDVAVIAWLVLGLVNVIAALGTLFLLGMS